MRHHLLRIAAVLFASSSSVTAQASNRSDLDGARFMTASALFTFRPGAEGFVLRAIQGARRIDCAPDTRSALLWSDTAAVILSEDIRWELRFSSQDTVTSDGPWTLLNGCEVFALRALTRNDSNSLIRVSRIGSNSFIYAPVTLTEVVAFVAKVRELGTPSEAAAKR